MGQDNRRGRRGRGFQCKEFDVREGKDGWMAITLPNHGDFSRDRSKAHVCHIAARESQGCCRSMTGIQRYVSRPI